MAVKAPPGFEPDDAEKRRVNAPPARSRFRKEDLYRSVLEFQSVDDHAIKVSQVEHDNFTDLIWHLVYSTGFRTELEKVRVIFRWMTSKNMHAITFRDGAKPGSPEDVLLSFQNKQGTYARTFEVLCRFAGLTSTILTGYAKGLDYRPGNQFKESNYNHSWNAVLIDGSWYLIDSHWATRYLVSEKNVAENLVYEYDDFFFLTDPEHLIYSHWSQAKEWQLLDRPVSLQDFESMPLVKSYFFKCAMHFVSHQQGVISTQKGRLALTLGYRKPTNFSYKITFADSGEEMYEGHKLKNYALQHHGHNHTDTIVFRAPRAGAYYFSFFAQLLTGEVGVKSTFTAACEYKVVADMASPAAMPLPLCSDATWGPGFAVEQLGLVANPPEGILTTTDGRVFLEFRKTKPAFVLCKLRRNGVEEEELERYIRDNDLGEAVQVTFQLPSTGEYGIEVYGNDPSKDGDTYTHICQYYVHYASPDEQQRAFYQESPERRAAMESFTFTVAAPDAYQPGSVGLESATASMALSDPDSLPPPPPELLDQQHYMPDTVPDTRQQQRYMPGQAPDTYQQQQQYSSYAPGVCAEGGPQPSVPQAVVTSMVIPASTKPLQVQKRSVGQAPPTAPRDFQLVAVDQGQGEAPPPVPASTGPQQQKPSLQAIDQQVLQSVDDHAVQVSKSDHNNFRDLVWDLIFSKNITNEIEKVRVIFCWLASKNLKEMRFDQVEKGSPEEVLMGLKTGVTTYAMLFNTMCSYAGLHSKIIGGYAKGVDYVPGMKFGPGVNQHTWNAIYIYGTWCLIDAHWGARRLMGKQTSEEDFQYQLDEYFFLTDPHQLIYTHFPDDPRWQLLERCVTLEEFESMPHMKPQFFKLGLELVTHRAAVVRARGGVKVALRFPQRHHSLSVAFNFTLQFENGEETYQGVKLNRFGMHDIEDGVATFNLRLPVTAAYILFIYAKEEVGDRKEGVYSQVCEYKIEYETEPGSSTEPFPPCSSLTWGPCSAFHRYGLTTAQRSPVMVTQEGKARLEIRHPRPMQFMARLKHIDASDADLESYVMQRTVGDTTIFDVSPPGRGEYGLEIFANDPATEGQTLYHNAQYLIVCQEDVRTRPLPKLPPGYLGPQPRFSEFGMATVSHPDPVIHLDCNTVTVVFQTRQPMRILANLIAVEGEEDFSSFTFSNTSGLNLVLTVHLPKPGFFKLQVFGTPVSDSSQQIPGIYNYLVNCGQVTQPVFPFPKQFAQWKEGCFMAEPMAIVTTHGPFASQVEKERLPDTITFCVDIPGAKKVATVLDQEWTALEQGSDKRWSGKVKVGQHYGTSTRLTLNANYGADKTNYATLLEYFL
ncbi:uncharacterized protein LOC143293941 [Babylonia areolata]|uniref:uncharacterized protein LOC143293941 n=1 Tax=Babylonia areolata TaxID=304850 RepID=UPI003FCFC940